VKEFRKENQQNRLEESLENLFGCPEPENIERLSPQQRQEVIQNIQSNQLEVKGLIKDLLSAKARIETSCNRYLDLFDKAPVAYFTLDVNGRVYGVNLAGAKMFGVERKDLIGRSFSDFIHPDNHPCFRRHVEDCLAHYVENTFRIELVNIPEKALPVRLRCIGVKDEEGRSDLLRITVIDMSEYRQTEKLLKEIQEKFQTSMDDIEDGYYEVDLKGNFTFTNQSLCQLFGYPYASLIGMNYRQYTDPDTARFMMNEFNQVYSTQRPVKRYEFPVIAKGGEKRFSEGSISLIRDKFNNPVGFRGIIRDISKRKQIEAALRESEEKYRFLVENATDGITIMQDKSVIFSNQKMYSMLGYSQKDIIDTMSLRQFVHSADQRALFRYYLEFTKSKKKRDKFLVFRGINKSGEERLLQVRAVLITWSKRPAVLSFVRDITSQKALEEKVQHALKMEAIGTLAGGIAHDFNNILGAIVLNTELALDDIQVGTETEYALDQVLQASQRAKELVDQILTFSRNAEVNRRRLKIDSIVSETIKMLRAMLPSTIVIRQDITTDIWTVMANPTQIQQLIVNLCTNAAHAMQEKGGKLDISLQNIVLDQKSINATGLSVGRYVQLIVADDGIGIASENQEKIFDPFFTTKRTGEGTGLGLSVVHGIVLKHRGSVTVKSKLGKGASFRVLLPTIDDGEAAILPSEKKITANGRGKTILFVDDEEALIDAGQRMLKRLGYHVKSTSNPVEALKLFRKQPEMFDLVITDMTMPHITGVELAKKIASIRQDIPIILCAGFNERISPERSRTLGIQGFIMKPYTQQEAEKIIREILNVA
jgi:PAS domain S-box-containing protein